MDNPHVLGRRRVDALGRVDTMPTQYRSVVHDLGIVAVEAMLEAGVQDPAQMRRIATIFWTNAVGQPNGRRGIRAHLDAMLLREPPPHARALAVMLQSQSMAILPLAPTAVMVDASLHALDRTGLVSKETKHRLRLRAAMLASAREVWPDVYGDAA